MPLGGGKSFENSSKSMNASINYTKSSNSSEILTNSTKITQKIKNISNKLIVESGATFNGKCKMGVKSKEINIGQESERQPLLQAQS